ncbi:CoA-binding protein [Chitinophaga sp. Cy-1792]|uniref:CoA-binding protein n=1 Tax=Chitinophaga sp. Cy-1792 TaxID=2608339 RepID=UPI00141D78A4|nr:CoA-binding protein [Chitinophaga sp. Cy-1792]NIG53117.1 CoA-binding protein [Chitinophaga sp. Cy-1792]
METSDKKLTVVLGASPNPSRYSYLAVSMLQKHGHPIVAIGNREGNIEGQEIIKEHPNVANVDTVTLYMNPTLQASYYDYILQLHPRRIIFNPGTENPELKELAIRNGIQPQEACTLVLLSTGQY